MLHETEPQDRVCSPVETVHRVSSFFAEFGITRLARHTGLDRIGIPVWCAYTPNAKSIVVAQGKGLTDDEARASAAMEAVERVVASQPRCDIIHSSPQNLASTGKRFDKLPSLLGRRQAPVADDEHIRWVVGHDLISGDAVHVPFDAVVLDRTILDCRYWQSSDGLASGNTLEEAIFHALSERIERDAYVLWQVSNARARTASCVDPATVSCNAISSLVSRIENAGLILRLFDITSDIGVPSFTALVAPVEALSVNQPRFVDASYGAGTHPSARKAILRAITEAVQSRMTFISGARDDIYPAVYRQILAEQTRDLLRVHPRPVAQDFTTAVGGSDFSKIVAVLAGLDLGPIIAVTLGDPHWPFAVAKVLAPRLENPEGDRAQRFGARALSKGSFG